MAWITDAELTDALAAWFREQDTELPTGSTTTITHSNSRAYKQIRRILLGRGFTAAQVDSWDEREEYNRDLGMYWSLVKLANLAADDKWVEKLNVLEELQELDIVIDGEIVDPGVTGSTVGWGEIVDEDRDIFSMDTPT